MLNFRRLILISASRYNLLMALKETTPAQVDISLSQGVKIVWSDGHRSEYPLKFLRDNCPCAPCQTAPATPATAFLMYKPAPKLNSAEAVGRYAVRLYWDDGHSTGIYSFDHLRHLCPCPECATISRSS